jgi:hypothetical protein
VLDHKNRADAHGISLIVERPVKVRWNIGHLHNWTELGCQRWCLGH